MLELSENDSFGTAKGLCYVPVSRQYHKSDSSMFVWIASADTAAAN